MPEMTTQRINVLQELIIKKMLVSLIFKRRERERKMGKNIKQKKTTLTKLVVYMALKQSAAVEGKIKKSGLTRRLQNSVI